MTFSAKENIYKEIEKLEKFIEFAEKYGNKELTEYLYIRKDAIILFATECRINIEK